MKKADIIRFENTSKQFNQQKDSLFECILLDIVDKLFSEYFLKKKKWLVERFLTMFAKARLKNIPLGCQQLIYTV